MPKPAELYRHKHTQLRRCLVFLLFAFFSYNSFATTACIEAATRAVILDPNVIETDYWHDNPKTGFFRIDFNNGSRGYGIGAYVSDNYVLSNNDTELYDNGVRVVGGEKNGNYCFCKLFFPVVSKWILHPARKGGYAWLDQRGYGCDGYCGYSIRYSDPVSFKVELYNSVQN